ncbi:MAG: hypothetical protein SFW67_02475 [Myxococcaceae bacterium]|nr:hypothetical protein [Myxococcaceae bacterium]
MATETETKAPAPPELPEGLKELQEKYAPQLEDAMERLTEANEQVKTFIRKNPGTVLLGAAAVGFLIGRWAARR